MARHAGLEAKVLTLNTRNPICTSTNPDSPTSRPTPSSSPGKVAKDCPEPWDPRLRGRSGRSSWLLDSYQYTLAISVTWGVNHQVEDVKIYDHTLKIHENIFSSNDSRRLIFGVCVVVQCVRSLLVVWHILLQSNGVEEIHKPRELYDKIENKIEGQKEVECPNMCKNVSCRSVFVKFSQLNLKCNFFFLRFVYLLESQIYRKEDREEDLPSNDSLPKGAQQADAMPIRSQEPGTSSGSPT